MGLQKPLEISHDILLNGKEKRLLRRIMREGSLSNSDPATKRPEFKILIEHGLVVSASDEKFGQTLTKDLNRPIYNCFKATHGTEQFLRRVRVSDWNERRAWITLAIALAAFVKSFFF